MDQDGSQLETVEVQRSTTLEEIEKILQDRGFTSA